MAEDLAIPRQSISRKRFGRLALVITMRGPSRGAGMISGATRVSRTR